MDFKVNQKVEVLDCTASDGTCAGCQRGHKVAETGETGYVCELTEFLFEPVVVVHFIERNTKIGFRKHELKILEDYDPDRMEWQKVG